MINPKLERIYARKVTITKPEDVIVTIKENTPPFKVVCPFCNNIHNYMGTGLVNCQLLYPPLKFILRKENGGEK